MIFIKELFNDLSSMNGKYIGRIFLKVRKFLKCFGGFGGCL